MKTALEFARDTLIVIESIASGSTTANSLPNLARIAREGLTAIENSDSKSAAPKASGATEDENIEADAYMYACDLMEIFQKERAKRGVEIGTQGSLCDGIAWLYDKLKKLESASSPVGGSADLTDEQIRPLLKDWFELENCKGVFNPERLRAFVNAAIASRPAALAAPDDIRAQGWTVAVHNDYRLNGEAHTFWLFTKDGRAIKGEGKTDADALAEVRAALAASHPQQGERNDR